MTPEMDFSGGIDHVHIYVKDREKAAQWYADILGFRVNVDYKFWADDPMGPLTIENPSGTIHLALFARHTDHRASLAFGANAAEYLTWTEYLTDQGLLARETDHDKAWSAYFEDPDGNQIEITSYDHNAIRKKRGDQRSG